MSNATRDSSICRLISSFPASARWVCLRRRPFSNSSFTTFFLATCSLLPGHCCAESTRPTPDTVCRKTMLAAEQLIADWIRSAPRCRCVSASIAIPARTLVPISVQERPTGHITLLPLWRRVPYASSAAILRTVAHCFPVHSRTCALDLVVFQLGLPRSTKRTPQIPQDLQLCMFYCAEHRIA